MKNYDLIVLRLLNILERDQEFEDVVSAPVYSEYSAESKYSKLREYLEYRLGMNPLQEVPRELLLELPRIYRRLNKYGEIMHPVPKHECRKVSAIPAMTAEVLIHFVDFQVR